MDIQKTMREKAEAAKRASRALAILPTGVKNEALRAMADALEKRAELVLEANAQDLEEARAKGLKRSYLDRLMLNEGRIRQMAEGLRQTAALPDPICQGDYSTIRPNGLEIRRVRVPLGVIGIIYEARPNVTADAAGLCLKAGNAVLLRGGSEAIRSNTAISSLLMKAAYKAGIPEGALQFVEFTDREAVDAMTHMTGLLDVIIPRGGAGLIHHIVENSSVPVIETGTGVCHTFVDETADFDMAVKIAVNAKTSHPSVCNAMETLLVHAAIAHINKYNTGHSETIVTENLESAHRFQKEVDAAAVYVNASTRFTDGFEFGFGAEIGISTQKLHARGPMGLEALTSTKYLIYGEGQVR